MSGTTTGGHYDVLVIGAGSAGSHVASAMVEAGLSCAQVERWAVGGTCLNAGCDPTKTLLESAHALHRARTADRIGLVIPQAAVDWTALRSRVRHVIDTIRDGDGDANVRAEGIALFKDDARFVDPHTVGLAGGGRISADRVVIASGAEEVRPPIEGLDEAGVLTNVEIVDIDALPRRLAIIGGGTIATEFSQMFARLGVEVTVIGSSDRIMPPEEPELAEALAGVLARDGVNVITGTRVTRIARHGEIRTLFGSGGEGEPERELAVADMVLLAAGRRPVVDIGLEAAGVDYDDKDGITVDDHLRTSQPHIRAVGDCASKLQFTHVASFHASRLAEDLLREIRGQPAGPPVTGQVVPWVTFTEPELAHVGMTEAEAREAGHDIVTASMPVVDQTRNIAGDQPDGLVKLVVERGDGRILGGHMLGERAGDILAEVVLAMQHGLPVSAIAQTIHSYPTYGMILQFVAEQAETARTERAEG